MLVGSWLEFLGISFCVSDPSELSRELCWHEGREERLGGLLWLCLMSQALPLPFTVQEGWRVNAAEENFFQAAVVNPFQVADRLYQYRLDIFVKL